MVSSRDPERIFNRLIGRLLDGMVVPFIGAGVSIGAKHRGGIADLTNTRCMCERVLRALREKCQTREGAHCTSCVVRTEVKNGLENKISFGKACELWEWSCPGHGEGGLRRRCELVLDILKIPEFANMEPTDAHYYLAFLAREGLIDEVITTNYDTCIEVAYCDTFGFGNALAGADSPALVIDTLDEYRAKGGKRFAEGQERRRCLRVHKINGCARRLPASSLDDCRDHCKNILLTERDLQDWGKRGWARDLFRDRLRSRTLLFSGFGSDEPQVRHTALQVCEEFASEVQDAATTDLDISAVWAKPNAPFITAFGETLSFSQTQILRAYARAGGASLSPEELKANCFLGSDVAFFAPGGSSSEPRLPADLFWKRLFQAAFWRLLRKACGRESAIASFLLPVLPCTTALLIEALDWFAPQDAPDRIFGRFPEMLDLAEDGERVIPLARWVERVRTIRPEVGRGWYYPLADRPVLTPAVLLLIYLLIGSHQPDISWEALRAGINENDGPLGLSINGRHVFGDAGVRVYIAHRDVAEQLPLKAMCHGQKEITVAIQIVLSPWRARTRRVFLVDGKDGCVKVVTVRQISLLELFGHAISVPEAKKSLCNTLRSTFLLIDPGRPRVSYVR